MERKSSGKRGGKDSEENTDRGLFTRLVEAVIAFAVCCYLVKLGVELLIAVHIPLIIIAAIAGIVTIGYRVWKHKNDIHW